MLIAILSTGILIFLITSIISKKKKYLAKNPVAPITNSQTTSLNEVPQKPPTPTFKDEFEELAWVYLDEDVFKSHIGEDYEDYSYLTPEEAKEELQLRKEAGEYLSNEEYRSYMNAIASKNDDKWLSKVDEMTEEETEKWFRRNKDNGVNMSSQVWQAVHGKVAPMHEPILLDMLSKVPAGRVEGWVKARKREGYFFTDHVYEEAKNIYKEYLIKKFKKEQLSNK